MSVLVGSIKHAHARTHARTHTHTHTHLVAPPTPTTSRGRRLGIEPHLFGALASSGVADGLLQVTFSDAALRCTPVVICPLRCAVSTNSLRHTHTHTHSLSLHLSISLSLHLCFCPPVAARAMCPCECRIACAHRCRGRRRQHRAHPCRRRASAAGCRPILHRCCQRW